MARRITRRAQSVVPFGVGSIVEFENEALMPTGLDAWPDLRAERIYDDRLASRLHVKYFCLPPPKPERGGPAGTMAPLPYVRFPQWHFCPRCRALRKVPLFENQRPRCDNAMRSPRLGDKPTCAERPERSRPRVIPLRFLAVCSEGHVEDFPWSAWAHSRADEGGLAKATSCGNEVLYYYSTKRGGLGGLIVSCDHCGRKRSLFGATAKGGLKGWPCTGQRPWLGEGGAEKCLAEPTQDGPPVMLGIQRGASNFYFPEVSSSILIPPYSTRLRQVLNDGRVMQALEDASGADGEVAESVFTAFASLYSLEPDLLREAFTARRQEEAAAGDATEASFRHAEYLALGQERREKDDALTCRPQDMAAYAPLVQEAFVAVTLVERLTETRALTGFSRIEPGERRSRALSLERVRWRPAFRVRGEGIFLRLSSTRLAAFEQASARRLDPMLGRAVEVDRSPLPLGPGLVLVHTLAHLLIKRLSFEAGYGASSIRERIYYAPTADETTMGGLLLYTAAGDAEGTLGGLVGLGRAGVLERVVAGALEDARWCGSDPICRESPGQGPESLNLAACHACSLLPETSCEFQNRTLDRTAVLEYFGRA